MKNNFYLIFTLIFFFGCSNEEVLDPTIFNPQLSIVQNLNNGVSITEVISEVGIESLYGLEYGGGYIFHIDQMQSTIMVATDFSDIGNVSWGDIFDLDTSQEIGSGMENTELIVQGNLEDNSSNGVEFGNDNYAFKIVSDLEYRGFDDWFIPSSGSMGAIYQNVHSQGMGDFDEKLIYWSSTKQGYFPFVMGFNFDSWGGQAFPGSCLDVNGILIAREF